ncbi:Hypothetical protein, putative [Bodo saltans]|uniref:Uncharacterized protein n=1 Tax=Bodo saltans TaxID=75058 RepID=A0A0S4KPP1_BODSA|nr:Hypothetical protein, putative [Bodo saltans]|eukprot:CUI15606.1 Hypothetical protein, putative [Bodo saltans]
MNAVVWKLNTVFLDGECEKEGRNIEANVELLIDAFQHPKGMCEAAKHDDGFDDHFASILAAMRLRHRHEAPTTPKKTPSKGRIVRKELASDPVVVDLSNGNSRGVQNVTDHRAAVRDLLYGAEQLARIVPRRNRVAAQSAPRCPHCKLFEHDPKFFEVPVTAEGKSLYAASGARGKAITYGNLPLGIVSKDLVMDQLWLAVAKLQLPTYASLTLEQRASCCREHFLSHIGLPPWMEQLIEDERRHRRHVSALEADLDILKERNAEVVNEIRRQQKFLQLASSLKDTMNQEHERTALLGQLAVAKAELVDKRWQLEEAARKNARDKIHHNVETGLIALRTEETQRLLLSISMMSEVLNEAEAARAAKAASNSNSYSKSMSVADSATTSAQKEVHTDIREKIIDILGNLPSAEFGRSCRRSAGASKHPASRYVQCKHCLLPLSYAPYCGVTGTLHQEQLDNDGTAPIDLRPLTSDEPKLATPLGSDECTESSDEGSDASSPTHAAAHELAMGGSMEASRRKGSGSGRGSSAAGFDARRSLRRAPSAVIARSMSSARPADAAAAVDALKPKRRRRKGGKKDVDSHLGSPDSTEGFPVPISNSAVKSLGTLDSTDSASDIAAVNELFTLFASHTCRFVEAASRTDFNSMKLILEEVDSGAPLSTDQSLPQRFPATCAALLDLEERFMEWLYALSLEPPPPQHTPPGTSHNSIETDSGKLVRLKKDLRELQHSFAKRPNARSQGINLDEEAFEAIAFRTTELERRVTQLKAKLSSTSTATAATTSGATSSATATAPTEETPLTPDGKSIMMLAMAQAPPKTTMPPNMPPQPPATHHNFAAAGGRAVRMDYGSAMI